MYHHDGTGKEPMYPSKSASILAMVVIWLLKQLSNDRVMVEREQNDLGQGNSYVGQVKVSISYPASTVTFPDRRKIDGWRNIAGREYSTLMLSIEPQWSIEAVH